MHWAWIFPCFFCFCQKKNADCPYMSSLTATNSFIFGNDIERVQNHTQEIIAFRHSMYKYPLNPAHTLGVMKNSCSTSKKRGKCRNLWDGRGSSRTELSSPAVGSQPPCQAQPRARASSIQAAHKHWPSRTGSLSHSSSKTPSYLFLWQL